MTSDDGVHMKSCPFDGSEEINIITCPSMRHCDFKCATNFVCFPLLQNSNSSRDISFKTIYLFALPIHFIYVSCSQYTHFHATLVEDGPTLTEGFDKLTSTPIARAMFKIVALDCTRIYHRLLY